MPADRVLHILSQRPGRTGSGMTLEALVDRAAASGWEQRAVCAAVRGEPPVRVGSLTGACIEPIEFESDALPFPIPGMSDVMPYPSRRFSSLSEVELHQYLSAWRAHLARVVDTFAPDVIHVHHVWLVASLVAEVAAGIPTVCHCHGTGLRQLLLCPDLAPRVVRACSTIDHFVALHEPQREELMERLDLPGERVHVVGAGYRDDLFGAAPMEKRDTSAVVFAGKLSAAKGLPWLLDAVERIATRRPITLRVAGAGTGAEAEELTRRMRSLPFVEMCGQLSQAELAELLSRSAIFALPSMYEGLPLVLIEAAASGCRVVTTSLPGVAGMAAALDGVFDAVEPPRRTNVDRPVPADLPGFVDRLEAALDRALDCGPPPRPPNRQQMRPFTWDAVADRVEGIWRRCLGRSE